MGVFSTLWSSIGWWATPSHEDEVDVKTGCPGCDSDDGFIRRNGHDDLHYVPLDKDGKGINKERPANKNCRHWY